MSARPVRSLLLLAWVACSAAPEVPEPRNLLLVTLDTTRASSVSGFGGPPDVTPELAALGRRSAVFLRAWSESNITNPSHVTIFSGRALASHGVANNRTSLPEAVDTLPEAFQRAGFATAGVVGVVHVGRRLGWRGFDWLDDPPRRSEAKQVTDGALRWLRRPRSERFFLWVHYFDPHALYEPKLETFRRFYSGNASRGEGAPIREWPEYRAGAPNPAVTRWLGDARDPVWPMAMYLAVLHDTDAQIGRLLRAVPSDTAIVVTADHGESLGEHGIFYDHEGLFEPQLRVPLLFHVPGLAPRESALPVSTLDVAPTVAELFGLALEGPVEGLSLVSALAGRPDPALREREVFVHEHAHHQALAIREGDWKLIWQRRHVPPFAPGVALFHLGRDPEEQHDLSAQEPARVAAMLARLGPRAPEERPALPTQQLSDEAREQLRALGYVDPGEPGP